MIDDGVAVVDVDVEDGVVKAVTNNTMVLTFWWWMENADISNINTTTRKT